MVMSMTPKPTPLMDCWRLSVHISIAVAQFCKHARTETSVVQHKVVYQNSRESMHIFYQIQGQLYIIITSREWCDFVVYVPQGRRYGK